MFCVYKIVGQSIAQNTDMESQNPYKKWIETYSRKEFSDSVERAISIFDEVALSASDEIRDLMLDAFYKSTALEWHFWNDSYNKVVLIHLFKKHKCDQKSFLAAQNSLHYNHLLVQKPMQEPLVQNTNQGFDSL